MKVTLDSDESFIQRKTSSDFELNLEIFEQEASISRDVIDLRAKDN